MPSLLLRMLGMLIFLAAAIAICVTILTLVYAIGTRDLRLARRIITLSAAIVGVYAAVLFAGPLLARSRTLAPGSEVSFCGFDCHLHVSVAGASRPGPLEVLLRFRSDAKAVPEHPGLLVVRAVDAAGRRYAPLEPVPDAPLGAGESRTHPVRFDVAPGAGPVRIMVSWGGLDYLIPGPQNPLVQQRAALAIR
jgi:hypothetical protein